MTMVINPGKYNKKIIIFKPIVSKDLDGFKIKEEKEILTTYANVKTTKGMTLIINDTDFEKAYTNFTIRFPLTKVTRDMFIKYNEKIYSIEYLNNINEENIELEIQAKEITK